MEQNEAIKLGYELANGLANQLIGLSIGIVALTITFIKDVLGSVSNSAAKYIRLAWVLYLMSVICGIWTTMAITGTIFANNPLKPPVAANITTPASLQMFLFLFATISIVVGAWKGLKHTDAKSNSSK